MKMKARFHKIVASVLAVAMISSLPVTSAAAYTAKQTEPRFGSGIEYFQGTKDLIQKTLDSVPEYKPEPEDKGLARTVQERSGLSLGAVKTALGFGLFSQYKDGMIDTARFNLDEASMTKVLETALRDYYLSRAVTYDLVVEDGIVTGIKFEMRASLAAGLEEITTSGDPELTDKISAQAIAELDEDNAPAPAPKAKKAKATVRTVAPLAETEACEHEFDDPDFLWTELDTKDAEGYPEWSCEAALVCNKCGHTKFVNCPANHVGTGGYSAAGFSQDGLEQTDLNSHIGDSFEHDHEYGDATYYWSEKGTGGWDCFAVRSCTATDANDAKCPDTVKTKATVTSKTTVEPEIGKPGELTYTATFDDDSIPSAKKVVELPALECEHDYDLVEDSVKWGDDYKTCTADFICNKANCGDILTGTENNFTMNIEHVDNGDGTTTHTAAFKPNGPAGKDVLVKKTVSNQPEHTHNTSDIWTSDKTGHWHACDSCDEKVDFAQHLYSNPEDIEWAKDHSTCTATFTCKECGDSQRLPAQEIKSVETDSDITYTANFDVNGQGVSIVKRVDKEEPAPTHEHKYVAEFNWERATEPDEDGVLGWTCPSADIKCVGENQELCEFKGEVVETVKEIDFKAETTTIPEIGKIGTMTYTASFTYKDHPFESTQTADIPALEEAQHEHAYGEPTFEWAKNPEATSDSPYKEQYICTATFTCEGEGDCDAQTVKVPCEDVDCVVTDATPTAPGKVVYTASATVPGGTTKYDAPEYPVVLEQLPHEHVFDGEPEFKWSEDFASCEAIFTCTFEIEGGCPETKTVKCEVNVEVKTPATEQAPGVAIHTATVTFNDKEYTSEPVEVEIPQAEHVHNYEATFNWVEKQNADNPDFDRDGKPDWLAIYDGTFSKSQNSSLDVTAVESVTLRCASCGHEHTFMANEGITFDKTFVTQEMVEKQQWGNPFDMNSSVATAQFTDKSGKYPTTVYEQNPQTGEVVAKTSYSYAGSCNITMRNAAYHTAQMADFTNAFSKHYGVAAPYWTAKGTEGSMVGAIKSLCNMYPDTFVPGYDLDYMITMLTMAFMAYEEQLGDLLEMKLQDCEKYVQSAGKITDVQKLLLIHDWLANNASFDMGAITAMKSGVSAGSDPSQMIALGTLLPEVLGLDGAVCLGYASTYALLVQRIFKATDPNKPMVDFVQARFYADIGETSVAGGESGFGAGMFNETHYYNAVKVDGDWFYVDACYDDAYAEVMSQYRVETAGNISHNFFMFAPTTALTMFDGDTKYVDYIDSLYDGVIYERTPLDTNGNGVAGDPWDIDEKTLSPAYATDENGHVIWTQHDNSENETQYDNTDYEMTWFTGAKGEVNFDDNYWYYTAGQIDSYASFGDMGGNGGNGGRPQSQADNSRAPGGFGQDDGPDNADKLVRRPKGAPDKPQQGEITTDGSYGMKTYNDKSAVTLFHFGYGTLGDSDGSYGPYENEVKLDAAYREQYPELCHGTGLYNGKLYFNMANQIYTMDLKKLTEITLLKEYNTVHAKDNSKAFTCASFEVADSPADPDYVFTVVDKPIAAISIEDKFIPKVNMQTGAFTGHDLMPMLTVSIATNYAESTVVKGCALEPVMEKDQNGQDVAKKDNNGYIVYKWNDNADITHQVEAINYNPGYIKQMEQQGDNKNTEFMWCANVVEQIPMEYMMADLAGQLAGPAAPVEIDAGCEHGSFTEDRTPAFGLTAGPREITGNAHGHVYVKSNGSGSDAANEKCFVCVYCGHCEDSLPKGAIEHKFGKPTFNWSKDMMGNDDFLSCTATYSCSCGEDVTLPCTMFALAKEAPTATNTGSGTRIATTSVGDDVYQERKEITYPAAKPYLTVPGGMGSTGGDPIQVPVMINFNSAYGHDYKLKTGKDGKFYKPDFAQLMFNVNYEKDSLQLVDCTVIPNCLDLKADTSTDGTVSFQGGAVAPELMVSKKSGIMAVLTFMPKEDCVTDTPLPITFSGVMAINKDQNDIGWEVNEDGVIFISGVIPGDVNGDGVVDTADRTTLARYLADWDGYSITSEKAADLNLDGVVDTADRTILARHLADWEGYETLPYTGSN